MRIDGTIDSCPCLKVTQKSFGSQNSKTDVMFFRLSMPIECAEVFSRSAAGGLPGSGLFGPKNDLEDYDADSDFEVLMKTAHGHLVPDRTEREKDATKPELNNHKDYVQEKPSRLKQRLVACCLFPLHPLLLLKVEENATEVWQTSQVTFGYMV